MKSKWGNTKAYEESTRKAAGYGKDDWAMISEKMNALLKAFAGKIGSDPADSAVQALVADWKQLITDNFYHCTDEILCGLGQMYVADERFTKNMDKFAAGTAKLISQAIDIYCSK